jgi:hypothetical protein
MAQLRNKKINTGALDFDGIKANLKDFLRGQDELSDYDFEGSTLNTLLDVLAYNTHYNALYNNMTINEMFLDSASKRDSIISIAKSLGYTARSAACAKATVTVNISTPNQGPSVLSIPKQMQFTTKVDGKTYSFYNRGVETAISDDGLSYSFTDIELTQGTPVTNSMTYNGASSRFIIPNENVDLDTLSVRVQENSSSAFVEVFTRHESIADLSAESKVYYVKEIEGGLYEIYFGDDIISRGLVNGNVVHLEYFVSDLDGVNGARYFSYNGDTILSGSTNTIVTTSAASGGADKEDRDSIRVNAPKYYASQNRAVTVDDYKTLILKNFAEADSVTVWGGEDNTPPQYGKAFICVKPKTASKLTNVEKAEITTTILNKRSVVSVTPEIIDPQYLNIALDVTVYYNPNLTTRTSTEIEAIVQQAIFDYDDTDLKVFEGVYRHSKLLRKIDASEPSIQNSNATVKIRRFISPRYNTSAQYILNIINPIHAKQGGGTVQSTGFYIAGSNEIHYLRCDGVGNIYLYRQGTNAQEIIVNPTIGTVDYGAGYVDIRNLHITALADIDFEFSVTPLSNDVVSALNQIAKIARDHMTVTAIPDRTTVGDLRGGYNYEHVTSRS